MAEHGLQATKELGPGNNIEIWTVPAGHVATVNINICNRNANGTFVDLAFIDGGPAILSDANWVYWKVPVEWTCEKTAVVLNEGQSIVARCQDGNVNVQVWGFLQPKTTGLKC